MRIAIIGAGAAGCFLAQRLKELCPPARVDVYEGHKRPLMKVAITGGGRCNLTNSFDAVGDMKEVYPRGHRLLKRLFHRWNQYDTMQWFTEHGVELVVQDDNCVFPASQDAMQIVRTLQHGLNIHVNSKITDITQLDADIIVVTTGGARNFQWLENTGVKIEPAVPSLFPLKLQPSGLESLSGIVLDDVTLTLAGTKIRSNGIMLLTHFGVSGPAVLRLSSYGARHLAESNYQGTLIVNWMGNMSQSDCLDMLHDMLRDNADRQVNKLLFNHSGSRWHAHIINRAGINPDTRCKALNAKQLNRLVATLTADPYTITSRAPHKEEFVTCGGVSLSSVDTNTLECKTRPNLYFAGELLDIDGVTGGFNLQAAFTTANAVAEAIAR